MVFALKNFLQRKFNVLNANLKYKYLKDIIMTTLHAHHEELIKGVSDQFKEILSQSEQSIYIYLDDEHWACNQKFLSLVGYKSLGELQKSNKESFLDLLVDEKSQRSLVTAYTNAMEKLIGSQASITWKTKTGKRVKTNLILVPISYQGHRMALHFIS